MIGTIKKRTRLARLARRCRCKRMKHLLLKLLLFIVVVACCCALLFRSLLSAVSASDNAAKSLKLAQNVRRSRRHHHRDSEWNTTMLRSSPQASPEIVPSEIAATTTHATTHATTTTTTTHATTTTTTTTTALSKQAPAIILKEFDQINTLQRLHSLNKNAAANTTSILPMTNIMNMVSTLSRTTLSRRSAFVTRQVIREIQAMASTLSRRSAFETRQVVRKMQVMVSILSRRSAFERRQVIRTTWGGHDNMFFAVGACCPIPKEHRAVHTCKRAQICRLERTNLRQSVRICVLKSTSIKEQTEWDLQCAQDDLKIAEENAKYKDIIQMPEIDVYRHFPKK